MAPCTKPDNSFEEIFSEASKEDWRFLASMLRTGMLKKITQAHEDQANNAQAKVGVVADLEQLKRTVAKLEGKLDNLEPRGQGTPGNSSPSNPLAAAMAQSVADNLKTLQERLSAVEMRPVFFQKVLDEVVYNLEQRMLKQDAKISHAVDEQTIQDQFKKLGDSLKEEMTKLINEKTAAASAQNAHHEELCQIKNAIQQEIRDQLAQNAKQGENQLTKQQAQQLEAHNLLLEQLQQQIQQVKDSLKSPQEASLGTPSNAQQVQPQTTAKKRLALDEIDITLLLRKAQTINALTQEMQDTQDKDQKEYTRIFSALKTLNEKTLKYKELKNQALLYQRKIDTFSNMKSRLMQLNLSLQTAVAKIKFVDKAQTVADLVKANMMSTEMAQKMQEQMQSIDDYQSKFNDNTNTQETDQKLDIAKYGYLPETSDQQAAGPSAERSPQGTVEDNNQQYESTRKVIIQQIKALTALAAKTQKLGDDNYEALNAIENGQSVLGQIRRLSEEIKLKQEGARYTHDLSLENLKEMQQDSRELEEFTGKQLVNFAKLKEKIDDLRTLYPYVNSESVEQSELENCK